MMKCLIRSITVAVLSTAAYLSAQVAPGDAGWPDAYPDWWYNAGDPANGVIDATEPVLNQGNQAPLVVGQLKHIASEARDELDAKLVASGGAGAAVDALVDGFALNDPSNLAPANLGQLKAVSAAFFDRFAEVGFTPSSEGWPNTLVLDAGAGDNAPLYPWLDNVTPSNAALANIGQAKHLFSWDFDTNLWQLEDRDNNGLGDGIPDWWERYWFGDTDTSQGSQSNQDGDSYNDQLEFLYQTNPNEPAEFLGSSLQREYYDLLVPSLAELANVDFLDVRSTIYPESFSSPGIVRPGGGEIYKGYLRAPVSGNIEFYLSSRNNAELYLGTDPSILIKTPALIASGGDVDSWVGPYSLIVEKDQRYYVEARHIIGANEAPKSSHLEVAWQFDGMDSPAVIPSLFLESYDQQHPLLANYGDLMDVDFIRINETFFEESNVFLKQKYALQTNYEAEDLYPSVYIPVAELNPERIAEPTFLNDVSVMELTTYYDRRLVDEVWQQVHKEVAFVAVEFEFVIPDIPEIQYGVNFSLYSYLENDERDLEGYTQTTLGLSDPQFDPTYSIEGYHFGWHYPGLYLLNLALIDSEYNIAPPTQGQSSGWLYSEAQLRYSRTSSGTYHRLQPGPYTVTLLGVRTDGRKWWGAAASGGLEPHTSKIYYSKPIVSLVYRPPEASFAMSLTEGYVGDLISFDPTSSEAFGSLSYHWDFGDDSDPALSSTNSVTHAFTSPGEYSIALTVEDELGRTHSSEQTLEIYAIPNASISFNDSTPYDAFFVGDTFTFDGSSSVGEALTYEWDIGNDGVVDSTKVSFLPLLGETPGDHEVKLTVIDAFGRSDSSVQSITICPLPSLVSPSWLYENEIQEFELIDTDCLDAIVTWSFGDGSTFEGAVANYEYEFAGEYLVTAATGGREWASELFVREQVSAVISYPSELYENELLRFNGAESTGDDLTFEWRIDGNIEHRGALLEKMFYEPAVYNIELIVSDGVRNDLESFDLTISENPNPRAAFQAVNEPYQSETTVFDATRSGGSVTQVRWDFGDGTIVEGSYEMHKLIEHTYSEKGTYDVTLTVLTSDLRESQMTQQYQIQLRDSDLDQIPDFWELFYGFDINDSADAIYDTDGDMLSNLDEYLLGTDPTDGTSSDGDSLPDDWELANNLNVTPGEDSSALDYEPDGLTNIQEFERNTDPFNEDTDGDGLWDLADSLLPNSPLRRDHTDLELIIF